MSKDFYLMIVFLISAGCVFFIMWIVSRLLDAKKLKKLRRRLEELRWMEERKYQHIYKLANAKEWLCFEEYFALRELCLREKRRNPWSPLCQFYGVYILYNETRNMAYVGQSKDVLKRVNDHFSGNGNGDVYFDYRYGHDFIIKMLKLENSGFRDIDSLERHMIAYYDSYNNGYNKTRGNR